MLKKDHFSKIKSTLPSVLATDLKMIDQLFAKSRSL